MRRLLVIVAIAFAAGGPTKAEQPKEEPAWPAPFKGAPQKPRILIMATGGAIAGVQSPSSELDGGKPRLDALARLSGEQVADIPGHDMNDAVWLKLAHRINERIRTGGVDGIVVTHGPDTLEETAYFLDLVVKSNKPVVLVGSMRPATAPSADGPGNLYNAVAVAADPQARGRGVLVVANDQIHAARNVTTTDTTSVASFQSPNRGPAGLVDVGKITWFAPPDKPHTTRTEFALKGDTLPHVDILYAHANMDARLIDDAVENGAQGLIIAGVGDGNMTTAALDRLKHAKEQGVVVVRSTRLPRGVVVRNGELHDDELGFVASGELNPAKARVLLQLGLQRTRDPGRIQKLFDTY